MSAPKRKAPQASRLTPKVEPIVTDPHAKPAGEPPVQAPASESVTESDERAEPTPPAPAKTAAATKASAAEQSARKPRSPRKRKPSTTETPAEVEEPTTDVDVDGPYGPEDKVKPSNVHIPVFLIDPVEARCKKEGLSHGELMIVALEATYNQLDGLINPGATAGGSLFAPRRGRASRAGDGPLTPLNYRMREADFTVLDGLVDKFGASSRGHLITVALKAYLRVDN
ncbi:hypothetical protein ACQFYA_21060 [Promicromonospora sp. Marseille-Q5078]